MANDKKPGDDLEKTRIRVLDSLTPGERSLLRQRFGDGRKPGRTVDDVARQFTDTRERIRRIEEKALRKLKRFDE